MSQEFFCAVDFPALPLQVLEEPSFSMCNRTSMTAPSSAADKMISLFFSFFLLLLFSHIAYGGPYATLVTPYPIPSVESFLTVSDIPTHMPFTAKDVAHMIDHMAARSVRPRGLRNQRTWLPGCHGHYMFTEYSEEFSEHGMIEECPSGLSDSTTRESLIIDGAGFPGT